MEYWLSHELCYLICFLSGYAQEKKTHSVASGGEIQSVLLVVFFFFSPGSVSSSDVLVRFRRRCSVSSRRPRTVFGGAPSSPSQAGSTTLQT